MYGIYMVRQKHRRVSNLLKQVKENDIIIDKSIQNKND